MKKKVLILGASSDIGSEVINQYLINNYIVFAHYNKIKPKIKSKNLHLVNCNFESEKMFNSFFKKIKKNNFECMVNLIGYIDNKSIEKTNFKSMFKSLKVNFIFPCLLANEVSKKMKKNNFGRILQCSSVGVKFGGGINTYTYSLSKHSLEFIPNYYKNISKHNVLYNVLRIGVTKTKIHDKISKKNLSSRVSKIPQKRLASPNEIAQYIFYLASEKNTFISNQVISISGGE